MMQEAVNKYEIKAILRLTPICPRINRLKIKAEPSSRGIDICLVNVDPQVACV
jgi:hypothetical protein